MRLIPRRLKRLSTLVYFLAGVILVTSLAGPASASVKLLVTMVAVFIRGQERAKDGGTTWMWLVPVPVARVGPAAAALLGVVLLIYMPNIGAWNGLSMLVIAVGLAAWTLGFHARVAHYRARDYWHDFAYGAMGWLVMATVALSALSPLPRDLKLWTAVVIAVCCTMISAREEPLWIEPGRILARRIRLAQERIAQ